MLPLFLTWAAVFAASDRPATLELLLPTGATATLDGKAINDPRVVTVADFKPGEIRRVKVAVTFADGTTDERTVDVTAGHTLRVAVPQPGPEKAAVVGAHPLVPINSAAVSSDGRHIAVALDAKTVVLWGTAAGRPVRTLAGHGKPVLAVAFTPDGQHLLSASADATAVLWEVETGKQVRSFKGHTGAVGSVAFSPDGKRFLSGSRDGTAILWDADTGEQVHKLKWRDITAVAYSPDGKTLATASADATATLWDASTGKQIALLRGHREDVNCVAFSRDGRRVVTGSSDDTGVVWDVATGTRVTRTRGHTVNVHSAAFTPDGRRVITGEREELVVLADAATGVPVRTLVGHGGEIQSVIPNPDGKTALTASRDGTARLWDLTTGRELLTLTTDGTGKAWAAVSPDGLFDGTEGGRRSLGYRFRKGGFGDADQFFAEGFRPGLLAEVWRGERPFPARPLNRSQPPLVKLTAPKGRTAADATVTLTADVTDQGGGVGAVVVENNGVRLSVPTKGEPGAAANVTRVTFTVPLAPGANRVGVRACTADGSRESAAAEVEVSLPRAPGQRGRLYVVAVGTGDAAADARALAKLLSTRGDKVFDRVDVVPVFDTDATRTTIEDTIKDVAELTRPQDTLVVLLCGYAFAADDIATALGTAGALNRVLVADAVGVGDQKGRSEFGLRGTVERWGRANGVHVLAAVGSQKPTLARSLLEAAGNDATDVTDWLLSAAKRPDVQAGIRARGFPLLGAGK
jgi:WD40 repeat protein